MTLPGQFGRNAITVARLAAIVVVFLFGHDVMMAMSPHDIASGSHPHQVIDPEECGASEGLIQFLGVPPVGPAPIHCTPLAVDLAQNFFVSVRLESMVLGQDSSALRVWLQVFLN